MHWQGIDRPDVIVEGTYLRSHAVRLNPDQPDLLANYYHTAIPTTCPTFLVMRIEIANV